MFSDRYFKENDALKEFMFFCINEYGMIPDINGRVLKLLGRDISIGITISADPLCLKILFINCICIKNYYNTIMFIGGKLIEYANKYNVTLGIWIDDIYTPLYKRLGFKVIEVADKVWMEYSQLLN